MRAGVYVRISRDPQGLRAGVERQRVDCEALCERLGWEVADVYEDNDVSAYSGKPRPAYLRLLEDVEARQVEVVVAWHNDRLHRSLVELETFINVVERTGVGVAMVEGGTYDLTTPEGRMTARIVGSSARYESEHKSARVRRKHLELAERGRVASWQGWGVRSETERELVREAAGRVLGGQGLKTIVRDWNERGVPAPKASRWSVVAARRVLLSARIAGLREHGRDRTGRTLGSLTPATWEGAVDRETWEQVRSVLLNPDRTTNGGSVARKYLLSGFVECGDCGGKMRARPRNDGTRRYVCVDNRPGHQLARLAEPVEGLVKERVLRLLTSPVFREELLRHAGATEDAEPAARALAELASAERRLEVLDDDYYVRGTMPEGRYVAVRAKVEREVDRLRALVEASARRRVLLHPDPRRLWEEGDLQVRRELTRLVVERVVLLPARRGLNRFDPGKVLTDIPLLRLWQVGSERWESMTPEEREAGRLAYEVAAAEDTLGQSD